MNSNNKIFKIENKKLLDLLHNPVDTIDDEIKKVLDIFSAIILCSSEDDIHLDYADFVYVLENAVESYVVSLQSDSKNSVTTMIKEMVQEVLLDNNLMEKIVGVLINFKLHPDFDLSVLSGVMEIINENTNKNCVVIFGTCADKRMNKDDMELIAIISYL